MVYKTHQVIAVYILSTFLEVKPWAIFCSTEKETISTVSVRCVIKNTLTKSADNSMESDILFRWFISILSLYNKK